MGSRAEVKCLAHWWESSVLKTSGGSRILERFQYAIKARVTRLLEGLGGCPPPPKFFGEIFDLLRSFQSFQPHKIFMRVTCKYGGLVS